MIGKTFGRLTVIEADPTEKYKKWICQCICGKTKTFRQCHLVTGHSKSCGCLRKETCSNAFSKHKKSSTSLYRIWTSMIDRCENEKNTHYHNYGGRGIGVCSKWRKSFEEFHNDMGYPPIGMTLDRVNNSKGYSPDNCRWATKRTQAINKRKRKGCTSDYIGVYLHRGCGKWVARCDGKDIGYYLDELIAAKAYNERAKDIFGKDAPLNNLEK